MSSLKIVSILVGLLLFSELMCSAQENDNPKNGIFVEGYLIGVGGHTGTVGWGSINYNRKMGKKNRFGLRTGLSADFESAIGVYILPTFISNPKGNHHFEGGLGMKRRIEFYNGNVYQDYFGVIPIMYRYESDKGALLRAGINYYCYMFALWYPTDIYFSLSLGYAF